MYEFRYHRPGTVRQAANFLAKNEDAKVIAGGHTLIPVMKQRLASPPHLVDLSHIEGLNTIEMKGRSLVIGATAKHAEVANSAVVGEAIPALAHLAGLIGDPAVRHKGTIGGSLANNDPTADYPAAVMALGATIVTNKRKLKPEEFFQGLFTTALEADEIITKVMFPLPKKAAYIKFRNQASRYALVGVFVAKRPSDVRVAVTGAGSNGVFRVDRVRGGAEEAFLAQGARRPDRAGGRTEQRSARQCRIPCASDRGAGAPRGRSRDRQVSVSTRRNKTGIFMTASALPASVDAMLESLTSRGYLAERSLATVTYLSLRMGRPLFLEGEAGVGKTEIAKVLASALKRKLIRLQCYEGLDVASAVYEWNSAAQMIAIRLAEAAGDSDREQLSSDIFADRYLIKRPLLQALEPDVAGAPVLLIDELDRADEAFEAYLLEILSDFQITIPEFGTVKAPQPPIVIITSNRTREIHDALKRRCLYHWVDYPSADRELAIIKNRVPGISAKLSQQVVRFVQALRNQDFYKSPGVAETIDWATALSELDARSLTPQVVGDTLGALLKYQDDIGRMQGDNLQKVLKEATSEV